MARYRNLGPSTFFFSLALVITLTGLLIVWRMPAWLAYFFAVSLVTFGTFGWDKFQAKRSRKRIPENCLHALTLIGGTLGSLAGQKMFRHKTAKGQFQRGFWIVVGIQALILIAFATLS